MRIVVDGDSVAMVDTQHPEDCWPTMLGEILDAEVEVLAKPESTARDCLGRIGKVIRRKPVVYVLQIGQWSQDHEPLWDFQSAIKDIVYELHLHGINVILVEPPTETNRRYMKVCELIADCACAFRVAGYVQIMEKDMEDGFLLGQTVPCHFNKKGATIVANDVAGEIKEAGIL